MQNSDSIIDCRFHVNVIIDTLPTFSRIPFLAASINSNNGTFCCGPKSLEMGLYDAFVIIETCIPSSGAEVPALLFLNVQKID